MNRRAATRRMHCVFLALTLLPSCAALNQPGARQASPPPSPIPNSNGVIAFTGGNGGYSIDVVDLSRPGWRDLTDPSGWETDLSPRWSPDGTRIAFRRYTNIDQEGRGDYELFVAEADGTGVRNLTGEEGIGDSAAWAPDSRRIAYACYSAEDATDICVVDVETGEIRRVTRDPAHEYDVAWSPDGSRIAFQRGMGKGDFDIFTIAPDGSNPVRVTESPAWEGSPAWSPDGQTIALVRNEARQAEIHVVSRDGTGDRKLAHLPGSATALTWSPAGDRVAFQAFDYPSWNVYIARLHGGELEGVATRPTDEVGPTWSPDGSILVFSATEMASGEGDNAGSFDLYRYRGEGNRPEQITHGANELAGDLSWQPLP